MRRWTGGGMRRRKGVPAAASRRESRTGRGTTRRGTPGIREMWRGNFDGCSRAVAILKQHEIAEEWPSRGLECAFAVRGPDVGGAAQCFFGPVIEVVTERGA